MTVVGVGSVGGSSSRVMTGGEDQRAAESVESWFVTIGRRLYYAVVGGEVGYEYSEGSSVGSVTPEPRIDESFRAECADVLKSYISRRDAIAEACGEALAARVKEDIEGAEGITSQFEKDILRRSVVICFGGSAAVFEPGEGPNEVEWARIMLEEYVSADPRWLLLAQAVCTQTTQNETGLNRILGSFGGIAGSSPFYDWEGAPTCRYGFDLGTPEITIVPEKGAEGEMRALLVSCHLRAPMVRKEIEGEVSRNIETFPVSLEFLSSYRIILEESGDPVVEQLIYSVALLDD